MTGRSAAEAAGARAPEYGKTICVIEHNFDLIKELADPVIFLDQGRAIAAGAPDEIVADSRLADLYFGV